MKTQFCVERTLADFASPQNLEMEFLHGLAQKPKRLPCKLFYDERGSALFDQICELDEYYPTRTETQILSENMDEIAACCGADCLLVELGSGSSHKTRRLLEHLENPAAYVPIDISQRHLMNAAAKLRRDFFPLEVLPLCADYSETLELPTPTKTPERKVTFFPGSTIGNFEPQQARRFLERIASWSDPGDGLLIGVDLAKEKEILERAYNDSRGITAAFNLNLLRRANRELAADFQLNQFRHRAIYNEACCRIEMHLVSLFQQLVHLENREICFDANEPIVTEYSYKYRLESFRQLACAAGWRPVKTWTDPRRWFSVHFLTACSGGN